MIHILPMRNWNYEFSQVVMGGYIFTSYLWGIETYQTLILLRQPRRFTFYLWGIETSLLPYHEPVNPHSHPTYEELKPKTGGFSKADILNSHPTYEELKHSHSGLTCATTSNSHPTYEELKPDDTYNIRSAGLIHILPMRNWNIYLPHKFLLRSQFTSYLWGIETIF